MRKITKTIAILSVLGMTTVDGLKATNYWQTSLIPKTAYAPSGISYFISTGFDENSVLSMHRHRYANYYCWAKDEIIMNDMEGKDKPVPIDMNYTFQKQPFVQLITTYYTVSMENICGN